MRFEFTSLPTQKGEGAFMPFLPLTLSLEERELKTHGLLDTGSTVNVLPFSTGLELGLIWEEQKMPLRLGGNLSAFEACIVFVNAFIEGCPQTELAFAWTKADNIPLLLGQTNFFMEFDVFFSRSAMFFEVMPKGAKL
ncbi:MAG: hypothetical protein KIS77_16430 [Saprospiraceae bacterium]|nr:hypothetical protein [Saprospiraceae bacterium]